MSQNIDFLMDRAKSAILNRDFALAKRMFNTILQSDKNHLDALLGLGLVYVKAQDDLSAIEVYQRVLKIDRENFEALNELGGIYRRLGKYDDSIDVLETAFALGNNQTTLYYNMGHTYRLKKDYDNALMCFEKVIENNPSDVLAYNHLGAIYAQLGDHKKALQSYQKGLIYDQNHPVLHYNAATSYRALGMFRDAQSSYEKSLRSKPGWVEVMEEYASLLSEMEKQNNAIDVLQQALTFTPENTKVQGQLADLFYDNNRVEEAKNLYGRILEKEPGDYSASIGLAQIYEKYHKYFEASALLKKIAPKYPENKTLQFFYTKMLVLSRQLEDAACELKKIRKNDPRDVNSLNLLGQFYILENDDLRVKHCAERIAEIDELYVQHYKDFAQLYFDLDKFVKALENIQEYTSRGYNDTDALYLHAEIHEKLNNFSDALGIYQKLLENDGKNTDLIQKITSLRDVINNPSSENDSASMDYSKEPSMAISMNPEEESLFENKSNYENDFKEELTFDTEIFPEVNEKDYLFDLDPMNEENFDSFVSLTDTDIPLDYKPLEKVELSEMDPFWDSENLQNPLDFEDDFELDSVNSIPENNKTPSSYQPSVSDKPSNFNSSFKPEVIEENLSINDSNKAISREIPLEKDLEVLYSQDIGEDSEEKENINSEIMDVLTEMAEEVINSLDIGENVIELNENMETDFKEEVIEEPLVENENSFENVDTVDAIVKALQDKDVAISNSNIINLLKYLRSCGNYLPNFQKEAFMVSFDKIRLDAIIDRLEGKPGLLAVSKALRQSGLLGECDENLEEDVHIRDLGKLISYLFSLAKNLDNEFTIMGLCTMISNFLHRWNNAELKENSPYEEF